MTIEANDDLGPDEERIYTTVADQTIAQRADEAVRKIYASYIESQARLAEYIEIGFPEITEFKFAEPKPPTSADALAELQGDQRAAFRKWARKNPAPGDVLRQKPALMAELARERARSYAWRQRADYWQGVAHMALSDYANQMGWDDDEIRTQWQTLLDAEPKK